TVEQLPASGVPAEPLDQLLPVDLVLPVRQSSRCRVERGKHHHNNIIVLPLMERTSEWPGAATAECPQPRVPARPTTLPVVQVRDPCCVSSHDGEARRGSGL